MMRSEAISIIKRGLGFRQTQDVAIIAALQSAQRDLESGKTLPNWMLAFDQSITVTSGVATFTLPTGFLRLHEEYQPYYLNSSNVHVALPRKNPIEAEDAYPPGEATATGYPVVYTLENLTRGHLYPTPTRSFTLFLTAYKAEPLLATDIENGWLKYAANYIIGLAGRLVAQNLRDAGAMQTFSDMLKLGAQSYMGEVVEQELAGRPLIMGRNK